LLKGLTEKLKDIAGVIDVRGQGLMIGIELDRPCREILIPALKERLLFNTTRENVLRLLPPLIYGPEHVLEVLDKLPKLIRNFLTV
jgi:acetylornithine/N-succinyldiaminopimelate aminotransferase